MAVSNLLSELGLRVSRGKRSDKLSARVRRVLVETLYTQPVSLSFGVLMGLIASGLSAWIS
ncbi:MAG: hypothetical protein AAFQ13_05935, partial [Pseudomonadota bacterium]